MSTVERTSVVSGWEVVENAPAQERHRVLLAPGLFCTAAFFGEMLGESSLAEAGVKALATTPPGFGGNPLPDGFDCSIESYAGGGRGGGSAPALPGRQDPGRRQRRLAPAADELQ